MSSIQDQYQKLNRELFGGELPFLPCLFNSRFTRTLGRCQFQRKGKKTVPIKIEIQAGLQEDQLRKTLIHEMCHVWAMLNHQETGHGTWFWKKMTALGYPEGHVLDSGAKDKWSAMEPHAFQVGERVYFLYQKQKIQGRIIRINKKSITVASRRKRWRISPSLLSKET